MKRNIFVKSIVWRVSSAVSMAREQKSDSLTAASSSVAGVRLFGGPRASKSLNIPETRSFHHEYNSMACTVEIVDDVHAAIGHIHQHGRHVEISQTSFYFSSVYFCGDRACIMVILLTFLPLFICSAHTDCIVTEDHEVAEIFLRQVDR